MTEKELLQALNTPLPAKNGVHQLNRFQFKANGPKPTTLFTYSPEKRYER